MLKVRGCVRLLIDRLVRFIFVLVKVKIGRII